MEKVKCKNEKFQYIAEEKFGGIRVFRGQMIWLRLPALIILTTRQNSSGHP